MPYIGDADAWSSSDALMLAGNCVTGFEAEPMVGLVQNPLLDCIC